MLDTPVAIRTELSQDITWMWDRLEAPDNAGMGWDTDAG